VQHTTLTTVLSCSGVIGGVFWSCGEDGLSWEESPSRSYTSAREAKDRVSDNGIRCGDRAARIHAAHSIDDDPPTRSSWHAGQAPGSTLNSTWRFDIDEEGQGTQHVAPDSDSREGELRASRPPWTVIKVDYNRPEGRPSQITRIGVRAVVLDDITHDVAVVDARNEPDRASSR